MELGRTIVVSEINLGMTVYGCYTETISDITYSYFRNRYMTNHTDVNLYTSPSVQWGEQFWPELGDCPLYYAYIPYYGISGKALNGVCFKDKGIDPVINQGFNWRAASPVEGKESYNNARVFNFQRVPTEVFQPFWNQRTDHWYTHHIQVTNEKLIWTDNETHEVHEHVFHDCEPCVICYVIKASDAVINNNVARKIKLQERTSPTTSTPLSGISWKLSTVVNGPYRQLWLSGDDFGYVSYINSTVHIYKIKQGADLLISWDTNWDYLQNVEEVLSSDPNYPLYNEIVNLQGDSYQHQFTFTGKKYPEDPESISWITDGYIQYFDWPTFGPRHQAETWICNTYNYHDDYDPWTGTYRLRVNVTIPRIGPWKMRRMNPTWTPFYERDATEDFSTVTLGGWITADYPGLWSSNMLLNFLDSNNTLASDGNYTTAVTTDWGEIRAGVFLQTSDQRDSNYIYLSTWDCGIG